MLRKNYWVTLIMAIAGCSHEPPPAPHLVSYQLFEDCPAVESAPRIRLFREDAGDRPPLDLSPKTLMSEGLTPKRFLIQRVRGGYLVGTSIGEFGGQVIWVSSDGKRRATLIERNCVGMIVVGDQALLLTGIAHLSLRRGSLHRVGRQQDGRWAREKSLPLIGTPEHARWTSQGDLEIRLILPPAFLYNRKSTLGPAELPGETLLYRAGTLTMTL